MPALVAGIHVFTAWQCRKTWMAGTIPAMTSLIHISKRNQCAGLGFGSAPTFSFALST